MAQVSEKADDTEEHDGVPYLRVVPPMNKPCWKERAATHWGTSVGRRGPDGAENAFDSLAYDIVKSTFDDL